MEIAKRDNLLPDSIDDLHTFILIGNEQIKAHKARLRAIDKTEMGYAAKKAALTDGQTTADLLLEAEGRLGAILAAIPKPKLNKQINGSKERTTEKTLPPTISKKESHTAQTIARNPDIVEAVKAKAKEKGELATTKDVVKAVKKKKKEQAQADIEAAKVEDPSAPLITHADYKEWLQDQPDCDLLLTDPPYMTDVEDITAFAHWLPEALAKVKNTGRAYIFIGAYPEEIAAYLSVANMTKGKTLSNLLVWTYRNTLGPSPKFDYKLNWQAILYFRGKDAPPLDCPIMTEQFSVQDINAPDGRQGDRFHAWQKPDEIAERFIRHSTKEGGLVCDPFAGTGTFLLAATRLGRMASGCEKDADILKIAQERGCRIWITG